MLIRQYSSMVGWIMLFPDLLNGHSQVSDQGSSLHHLFWPLFPFVFAVMRGYRWGWLGVYTPPPENHKAVDFFRSTGMYTPRNLQSYTANIHCRAIISWWADGGHLCLLGIGKISLFEWALSYITPDRRQSKTFILSTNVDQK